MPRTAIVLRHLAFEDLGVLAPLLTERDYAVEYRDAGVDELDPEAFASADLAVVLGGPIGVGDLEAYPLLTGEIEAVRRRLAADRPTLGICLGAQLMAAALGAAVTPGPVKEIGFAPLTGASGALAGLGTVPVLHWHGDTFALPEGAELLASTVAYPNQAFAIGSSLALQFHLEADPARIEQWLIGHAAELAGAGVDPRAIRADAITHGPALVAAGQRVLGSWLDGLG